MPLVMYSAEAGLMPPLIFIDIIFCAKTNDGRRNMLSKILPAS